MDAGLKDAIYEPAPEELAGIERGLRDAEQGGFATEEEVEAVLTKFRRAGRSSIPPPRLETLDEIADWLAVHYPAIMRRGNLGMKRSEL
jgi:hypothetical protein